MTTVYGSYVQVAECPCCQYPPVDFNSEEGKQRRRKLVEHHGKLSTIRFPLAAIAVLSGAATIGLSFANPQWPFLSCFPFVNGVLLCFAAFFGRRVGTANLDNEIPASAKRNVIVHYVLSLIGVTFCGLAAAFSGVCLGFCLSDDPALSDKCSPNRDVKMVFVCIDLALGILQFPFCIVGLVLFCMHARTLGFSNRYSNVENEVAQLRAEVAALRQAQGQGQGQGQAPPAYSEVPAGGGGGGRGGYSYSGGPGSYGEYGNPAMTGYGLNSEKRY